jgi:hypothetical protein
VGDERVERLFDAGKFRKAADRAHQIGGDDALAELLWQRWSKGVLSDADLRNALPEVWTFHDHPASSLDEAKWLKLFRATGFVSRVICGSLISANGGVVKTPPAYGAEILTAPPTSPRHLWRGSSIESGGRGFSWTSLPDRALAFAEGWEDHWKKPFGVFEADVPGSAILAFFADDQEEEVVVDPTALGGLMSQVEPESWLTTDEATS